MAQIAEQTEENAVDVLHLHGEAKPFMAQRFGCGSVKVEIRTAKRGVQFWMERDEAVKFANEILKETGKGGA